MKTKNLKNKGLVWGLTKINLVIGSVLLFSLLWSYNEGFMHINSLDSAMHEAKNIARLMDEAGGTESCEIRYTTPEHLSGEPYHVRISQGNITVFIEGGNGEYTEPSVSSVKDNFSFNGGYELTIKKSGGILEVF